jgi:NADPH-dependent 2,4-dienoyl-CoA reductase/sulfur reductase-like enzyme
MPMATWCSAAAFRPDRAQGAPCRRAGVGFDRLLIATGTRARQWPNAAEGALDGVFTMRTRDDAVSLRERLAAGPDRVLIIGGGFTARRCLRLP